MTNQIDPDADTRTERALTAYLRQELSAPATAIMGYAEILMNDAVRSGRETTQPNLTDLEYWAQGLTPVYLEGALRRALEPAPEM